MFIKGFDKNLCCRGYQFEVGKEYRIDNPDNKELKLCSDMVFHFCDNIENVHRVSEYEVDKESRYCEIEVLGDIVFDNDTKYGSNHIKIIRELSKDEIDMMIGRVNDNTGLFNTGKNNIGDYNAGYRNSGNYNVGHRNSGNYNVGHRNVGNYNVGHRNVGNYNVGHRNVGKYNTGNYNSGDRNTGNSNTGDYNSGDRNTGHRNSGMFNSCDYSSGDFCKTTPNIRVFDMDTGMTRDEYIKTDFYRVISESYFTLTEWIFYTKEEMNNDPNKKLIGGYLKRYTYNEACANWWESLSETNKAIIKEFEFFNADIFYDITGIDVREER